MYTLPLLSSVLCTLQSAPVARVCCTNIRPTYKLLVFMDLSSYAMIPFLTCSTINIGHPACFSFTFWICALSVVFYLIPGALRCGKIDFHCSYCESVHSSFHVSFIIFSHCLKPVSVRCKLVCWTILLLVVSPSSLEFLHVMLNFFSRLNYLSCNKSPSTLLSHQIFLSRFPTATSLPLFFFHHFDLLQHRTFPLCLTVGP
jgi:hypothetical protein